MKQRRQFPSLKKALARAVRGAVPACLLLLAVVSTAGAVTVTPSGVYIDHRSRTGTITLYNDGTAAEDIEIAFKFGYPQSDSTGNISVPLADSAPAGEPSALGWLRAFPRRITLQPGQRQVIRILAQPPADLADGEYWARVLVISRGGTPPVEQVEGRVGVRLTMETVIVNPVIYRKGLVQTGVNVARGVMQRTAEGGNLMLDLERHGNAAFLGRVRAELVAPNGEVIARGENSVAVYRTLRVAVPLPLQRPVPRGATIRYTIDNERPDLPAGGPLPTRVVEGQVRVDA